jgi:hypothetical protein
MPILPYADFPIGWYDRAIVSTAPQDILDNGFTFVVPYNQTVGNRTDYINQCDAIGLKVFPQITKSYVTSGNYAAITAEVNLYKSIPSVAGWYIYDEPDLTGLSLDLMANAYYTIKEASPDKPVLTVFKSEAEFIPYIDFADITSMDYYHTGVGYTPFTEPGWPRYLMNMNANVIQAHKIGRTWFNAAQGFGNGTLGRRDLEYDEIRWIILATILVKADGFNFFTWYYSQLSWVQNTLLVAFDDLSTYLPTIIQYENIVEQGVYVNNTNIYANLYPVSATNDYYLVLINNIYEEYPNTTIRLKSGTYGATTTVTKKARDGTSSVLPLSPVGTFQDDIGIFDSIVYEITTP